MHLFPVMTDTQVFSTKNVSKNGIVLDKEMHAFLNNGNGLFLEFKQRQRMRFT